MFYRTVFMATVFAVTLAVLLGFGAHPAVADAAETKRICEKAWKAYESFEVASKAKAGETPVLTYKYTFCPPSLTVKVGTTVRWINVEKRTSHSVWLKEAGVKESERLFPGESHTFTFKSPGKYPYLCGPHWEKEGMVGTVTVTP